MRKWVWLVILTVSVGVVVYLGFARIAHYKNYWLVSCPFNFRLEINKTAMAEITKDMSKETTLVYLACELKKTKEGAGSGAQEPFIYAQREEWMGIPRVTLYLDVPKWWEYDEGERNRVTGMLVMGQLAQQASMGREKMQEIKGMAYYATGGVVWLVEK